MKVTIIQTDIQWDAFENNASAARELISSAEKSDLYVLPEMWNTGFAVEKEDLSASTADAALQWMRQTAQRTDAAICGSVAIENDDRINKDAHPYRNRLYFVKPDGSYSWYDKRHLFKHGGENKLFAAGEKRALVEWRGWRFMLSICYDLRFPVWLRYNNDYDAIINVANWPIQRIEAWDVLTKARAIENQCYVIACNRTGRDKSNTYTGHSRVIDPNGNITAQSTSELPQCISADIELESLRNIRNNFNVLDDRDNSNITI